MIGSKYVDFSIATWLQGRLVIDLISQNASTNQSVYKAKLYISRKNSQTFRYYNLQSPSLYMTISGPGYNSTTNRTYDWNIGPTWILIREETATVTHNADGTPPSSTFYGAITDSVPGWNGNGTLTYTFPTIPRYTSITGFSLTGTDRGAFSFSWSAADRVSDVAYTLNGGTWVYLGNPGGSSGSFYVGGLSAGTQYNIKISVKRADSGLWTESGLLYPTTHAAAVAYTPTVSSITRSSFSISFTTSTTINGFIYSINGGSSWSGWHSASGSAGSFSVTGASPGSTYSVIVRVYDAYHGTLSGWSGTRSVTTSPAAKANAPQLSSRTGITLTVNWSSTDTVNAVRWSTNAGWNEVAASGTSGSFTINGRNANDANNPLQPGTSYQVTIGVKDSVSNTWSANSTTVAMTTYALCTVKGSNFNLGSNVTAQITETEVLMDYHIYLEAYYNGKWNAVTHVLDQGASAILTPNSAQIKVLENNHPNTNSVVMRFRVVNYWQGTGAIQGTSYSSNFTAIIVDANPTLSGITYQDVHSNADFITWKGGDQKILRNVSPVRATLGTATAIKGATLSRYVFTINGKSFTVNANGTATQTGAIGNLGIINSENNQSIEVTVYDSRNNYVSKSVTVSMIDWAEPQIIYGTGERLNSYEQPTYLNLSARYSRVLVGGTDKNSLTAQYRIKVKGSADSTYGAFVNIVAPKGSVNGIWQEVSSTQFMQNLDENTIYTMHIQFKDYVVGWRDYYVDIEKGVGLMEFFEDRIEVGVPTSFTGGINSQSVDGEDMNTITETGFYRGYNMTHAAERTISTFIVNKYSPDWIDQIQIITSATPKIYIRSRHGGTTWGAWKEVGGLSSVSWSEVTDKPTTFTPSEHTHSYIPLSTTFGANLDSVTENGVYRQETPSSGYSYTTTLNLNSSDGRQQLTIARDGSGMKFRGVNSGSGTSGWTGWKTVSIDGHTHDGTTTTGAQTTHTTAYGHIQLGPMNASYAHIYTDRPQFYFNKEILVNGTAVSMAGHTHNPVALYSGSVGANGSATMASMSGYTFLVVVMNLSPSSAVSRDTMVIPVANISYSTGGDHYSRISWGTQLNYGNFSFGSATNIKVGAARDFSIKTIYGVK